MKIYCHFFVISILLCIQGCARKEKFDPTRYDKMLFNPKDYQATPPPRVYDISGYVDTASAGINVKSETKNATGILSADGQGMTLAALWGSDSLVIYVAEYAANVGNTTLIVPGGNSFVRYKRNNIVYTSNLKGAGSITVTALDKTNNQVAGKFNAILYDDALTDSVVISDGNFKVNYKAEYATYTDNYFFGTDSFTVNSDSLSVTLNESAGLYTISLIDTNSNTGVKIIVPRVGTDGITGFTDLGSQNGYPKAYYIQADGTLLEAESGQCTIPLFTESTGIVQGQFKDLSKDNTLLYITDGSYSIRKR